MNEELNDFIEQFLTPDKPERDGSGRPLLYPRGSADKKAYTRASSLGDVLDDHLFLWKWKMRGLAKAIADRLDLARLVAAEPYTCGFALDEQANRAAGRNIDAVIDRALDHAGVDMKADYGTAIHLRTEPGNAEHDLDEKQDRDVEATWALWHEIGAVHLGTEVFTANDTLMVAGTFDHLTYIPGIGIIVTDKKTSSKSKMAYDVQLADYANSDVYDLETDQRMSLEEYVASKGWDPALLRRDVGMIWWVKNGKCEARQLDLVNGWKWAQVAAEIINERRPFAARVAKNVTKDLIAETKSQRERLLAALSGAPSRDVLSSIYNNPTARAIWTDLHTDAATRRSEELAA